MKSLLSSGLLAAVALVVLASASGCSAEPEAVGSEDDEMIGGKLAAGPEEAAVGRVFIGGIGGCVGTLVSPRIVISARHCRVLAAREGGLDPSSVRFEVRGNNHEQKTFRVVAELTTGAAGIGMLGIGRDVAVMMLAEPVPTEMATPIPVRARPLDATDIGRKLTGVAFDTVATWKKVKGRSTLDAIDGKPYQRVFGSFEEMRAAAQRQLDLEVSARLRVPEAKLELPESAYDSELVPAAYEVHVGLGSRGRARGDVQYCQGDSGGPLLDRVDGHYELVAVITGGEDQCLLGTVATKVGPDDLAALARTSGDAPWAWACDPTKVTSTPKVSRCKDEMQISCSGSYWGDAHRFTNINVESCTTN